MLSIVKDMLGRAPAEVEDHASEVADLVAKIAAERTAGSAAELEIERLEIEHSGARCFDDAAALDEQIARHRWVVDHARYVLPRLQAELAAAKARHQSEALARHWAALRQLYPEFKQAIETATALQIKAIKLRAAAEAELGASIVQRDLPILAYRGLLLPDLVKMWITEMDRLVTVPSPRTCDAVSPARRRPSPAQQPPAPLAEPAPAPRYQAPRRPGDDLTPLAPGEVRVQVFIGGWAPAADQPQCWQNQIIRMPRRAGQLAEDRGIVKIIERATPALPIADDAPPPVAEDEGLGGGHD
jgi:hypothetical protein